MRARKRSAGGTTFHALWEAAVRLSRRWAALLGVPVVAGFLVASTASSSHAQDVVHTFPGVNCTAVVAGQTLMQTQDVSIEIIAPDSVSPGQQFTISFPGGSAMLPTRASGSQAVNISAYSNLFQTVQLNGADFVQASLVNPGTATVNENTNVAAIWTSVTNYAAGIYAAVNTAPAGSPPVWTFWRSKVSANL